MGIYQSFFKPLMDFAIALTAFLCLLPVFLILVVFLSLANKGSAFFLQPRPGKNNRIFKVVKFKTMTDDKDEAGQLLADELRLTRIGSFVRKTSLDEIPQLINVIKGDMSLVGPRPLLVSYLPLYNETQGRRHEVRPGITGWAQVNGRNAISWKNKFELDVWYVDNVSLLLDIRILFLTIKKVFIREGISSGTSSTMEAFEGN